MAEPDVEPALVHRIFVMGSVRFQDRSGEIVKRFHVDLQGHERDGHFVLEEDFRYSDGTTQHRTWTLTRAADGGWQGTGPMLRVRQAAMPLATSCAGGIRCNSLSTTRATMCNSTTGWCWWTSAP